MPHGHRRRAGLTLIELLTVIVIILLLVAILAPSLIRVQVLGRTAQTQTIIHTLSNACHVYQQEFKYFPDAKETGQNNDDTPSMAGRYRLALSFFGETDKDNNDEGWRLSGAARNVTTSIFSA